MNGNAVIDDDATKRMATRTINLPNVVPFQTGCFFYFELFLSAASKSCHTRARGRRDNGRQCNDCYPILFANRSPTLSPICIRPAVRHASDVLLCILLRTAIGILISKTYLRHCRATGGVFTEVLGIRDRVTTPLPTKGYLKRYFDNIV